MAKSVLVSREELVKHLKLNSSKSKTFKAFATVLYRMLTAKERHALRLLVTVGPMDKNRMGFEKSFDVLVDLSLVTRVCKSGSLTWVAANELGYSVYQSHAIQVAKLNHEL